MQASGCNGGAVTAAVAGWPQLRRLQLTGCPGLGLTAMEAFAAHAPDLTLLDLTKCLNAITPT